MGIKKRVVLAIIFLAVALTLIFTFFKPGTMQLLLNTLTLICTILIMTYKRQDN
ncbi:hypothetical protein GCM10028778_24200 [Barrientosiimonas marina]